MMPLAPWFAATLALLALGAALTRWAIASTRTLRAPRKEGQP